MADTLSPGDTVLAVTEDGRIVLGRIASEEQPQPGLGRAYLVALETEEKVWFSPTALIAFRGEPPLRCLVSERVGCC